MGCASRVVCFAAFSLVIAGCSQATREPASQQSPASALPRQHPRLARASAATPRPARLPSEPLVATITPSPQVTTAPSPSPTPLATEAPTPLRVERLSASAPPQILDVAVSQTTVEPGDRVFGRVVTTSNVASVEAQIGTYSVHLAKVGVGRFELTYTVGPLPWFIHGHYTMQVIARSVRGETVTRAIPLTVR